MSRSDSEETYVLDACVVIDFCGRTDNLEHLLAHVGDAVVITSAVHEELVRQRDRRYPLLAKFLNEVDAGRVQVVDPDTADETAERILSRWSPCFGAGEVSSAALAASRRWVFLSRDREPMQQLRLSETILMESTSDVLKSLVRRRAITERLAADIESAAKKSSTRRHRK